MAADPMAAEPRLGHCGATKTGEGAACRPRDKQGAWTVSGIDDCITRCAECDRCYYVSYGPGDPFRANSDDCSWYTSCPSALVPEDPYQLYLGFGHHTVQVRDPESGHSRPRALHPQLPEGRRALRRYTAVLSELDPIPRVLHASFKVELNVSESTHPTIVHGLQSFQRHNPRWRVEVSSDAQVDAYLRAHLPADDYARVAPLHPVEKTDVWRLLKMWREGGIYTDIDRRWNVKVRSFVTNATRLVLPTQHGFGISRTEQSFDFSQDFMCSARHNPLFKDALKHVLAQRRKCDERCRLVDPRPRESACKLPPPRKQQPEFCATLDFGPGAWFRAVTKNLWGAAWLPYSANESWLPGFDGRTTKIRLNPLAHEFLRVGTPPLIVSKAEDGYFGVLGFSPKPGELLFGVRLPPRLREGASQEERREHEKQHSKAMSQAYKASVLAKRQLYASVGARAWQQSRRRA